MKKLEEEGRSMRSELTELVGRLEEEEERRKRVEERLRESEKAEEEMTFQGGCFSAQKNPILTSRMSNITPTDKE